MSDQARLDDERRRAEDLMVDLRRELAAIAEATAEVPDDEHDAEGSTVAYERARVQALLAQTERAHGELVAAGDRLAQGTYRCCQHCGEEIPAERLAALPATRSCINCASGRGSGRSGR
jgi:DnaK suppressor protein